MSKQIQYSSFADYQESTGSGAVTEESVRAFITPKAWEDEAFRAALVRDPGAVVEAEVGIKLPGGLRLEVHQETNDELHLVLPAPVELTPAQLQTVCGGWPTLPGAALDDHFYDPDGGVDHD